MSPLLANLGVARRATFMTFPSGLDPDLVTEWVAKLIYLTEGREGWHTVRGTTRNVWLERAATVLNCSGLLQCLQAIETDGDAKGALQALMLRALNSAEILDANPRRD